MSVPTCIAPRRTVFPAVTPGGRAIATGRASVCSAFSRLRGAGRREERFRTQARQLQEFFRPWRARA
eukprot:3131917-Lingulodinium_polyedra.AAC.1